MRARANLGSVDPEIFVIHGCLSAKEKDIVSRGNTSLYIQIESISVKSGIEQLFNQSTLVEGPSIASISCF